MKKMGVPKFSIMMMAGMLLVLNPNSLVKAKQINDSSIENQVNSNITIKFDYDIFASSLKSFSREAISAIYSKEFENKKEYYERIKPYFADQIALNSIVSAIESSSNIHALSTWNFAIEFHDKASIETQKGKDIDKREWLVEIPFSLIIETEERIEEVSYSATLRIESSILSQDAYDFGIKQLVVL
ncbi:hypothetical protein [Roseibium sp. RKSG952]|uniref:hypothetical protein n=1 Tax=Roseibium sp. RKSG952 TaxID=2529384 RepID=UPI0012BD0658|nr:hypothetical protein [Roseibium sp. RKSG952]MTH95349.1 hypothetical protein [Roseibium sp. RKSG952]